MKEFEGFNGTVDIIDYENGDVIDNELDPKEVEDLIEGIYRIVKIEASPESFQFESDGKVYVVNCTERVLTVYVEEI